MMTDQDQQVYQELKKLPLEDYQYGMITSTANQTNRNQVLPDRLSQYGNILNIQVASQAFAEQLFTFLDGKVPHLLVDGEQKQVVDLYSVATTICRKSQVHVFKANDVTVNATINTINLCFSGRFSGKVALVYGTGNLATKIALKLAELGVAVFIEGRNQQKVQQLVTAMNLILPAHTPRKIQSWTENEETSLDVLISAISAKKQLGSEWLSVLKPQALLLDVGIDNFSEAFIAKAVQEEFVVQRVDIQARIGTELADITTRNFYGESIRGRIKINGKRAVAGGIVGDKGDLVLDKIQAPYRVIGYSNGTGGLERNNAK